MLPTSLVKLELMPQLKRYFEKYSNKIILENASLGFYLIIIKPKKS